MLILVKISISKWEVYYDDIIIPDKNGLNTIVFKT